MEPMYDRALHQAEHLTGPNPENERARAITYALLAVADALTDGSGTGVGEILRQIQLEMRELQL